MSSLLRWPNWRCQYFNDLAYSKAIDIFNEVGIDRRTVKPVEGGIYTPELGNVVSTDENVSLRMYSCFCGTLNGRLNEGEICEECGTECKEQFGADLNQYGWIDLENYFIIVPGALEMIKSVVGAKALEKMIKYQIQINIEGTTAITPNPNEKVRASVPFQNIGLIEFKRRFVEIMTYFAKIKPLKAKKALLLIKYKNRVFSNKIPIYSTLLRPAYASGKKKMFSYDKINSFYTSIINNAKLLKSGTSKRLKTGGVLLILYSIQDALQMAYHCTMQTKLSGKFKIIRGTILSARTCFSSRAVISSLTGKYNGIDHIVLNYRQFIELYTLEILNCMMRGVGNINFRNMTLYELLSYLKSAKYKNECDETIYYIIEFLIKNHKQGLWVILNRNPTMDLGSIQVLKVVHVFKDPQNTSMQIPFTSLTSMTGDHDGDVLNIYSIKELSVLQAFIKGFSPRYLTVDRTGDDIGNQDFYPSKDYYTIISTMLTPFPAEFYERK